MDPVLILRVLKVKINNLMEGDLMKRKYGSCTGNESFKINNLMEGDLM